MKWVQIGVPKGLQIDHRGYLRITANGRHKWKYLHRRIMEQLLERTHPLTLAVMGIELGSNGKVSSIPERYDTHHINLVKTDNRPENMMLLDHAIHGRLFVNTKKAKKARLLASRGGEK